MKAFLSVLFLAVMFSVSAQYKKPIIVQIKTPQAQCAECKELIEKFMKVEEGVAKVVVDIRKKITTITYLGDRTNIENIRAALNNIGFDADEEKANEEQYKRLTICCKRVEDGGGPPKKN
nr:cation transporter [uncultured Lacibacter sp.]